MKIGVDIGGTNLAAGLVDDSGNIVAETSCPAEVKEGYQAVLERIKALVRELLESSDEKVDAIGCGVPGIVKDGVVINAPNVFWKDEPLAQDLEDTFGLPVTLINDATAAAVTEHRFGAGRGHKNSATYTLGTGVGGGLIINDSVVNGAHGVATEFGHMLVGPNFYTCNCGKNGCLETYASATGLIRRHQYEVENGTPSKLVPGPGVGAREIIDAAREGDEASLKAFEILVDKLSESISNMVDCLDPEIFIVGGGVSQAGDFLFDRLREETAKKLTYPDFVEVTIEPAEFGNGAGIIGAAFAGEYV